MNVNYFGTPLLRQLQTEPEGFIRRDMKKNYSLLINDCLVRGLLKRKRLPRSILAVSCHQCAADQQHPDRHSGTGGSVCQTTDCRSKSAPDNRGEFSGKMKNSHL